MKHIKTLNRDITRQALHNYIDSLDDEGMYELITDNEITGTGIYTCDMCEQENGACEYGFAPNCKKFFLEHMGKEAK